MLTGFIIGAVIVIGLGIAGYFVYKHNKKMINKRIAAIILKGLGLLPKDIKKLLKNKI